MIKFLLNNKINLFGQVMAVGLLTTMFLIDEFNWTVFAIWTGGEIALIYDLFQQWRNRSREKKV